MSGHCRFGWNCRNVHSGVRQALYQQYEIYDNEAIFKAWKGKGKGKGKKGPGTR